MATDKPRAAVRRAAPKAPDPRVDDLSGEPTRNRTRVPRPQQPENPLDRVTAFETTARPAPGVPPVVPAGRVEFDDVDDAFSGLQFAPPPPAPVRVPLEEPPTVDVRLPMPQAAPAPAPAPTEAVPATESPGRAAALLDLGGRRDGNGEPDPARLERVLAPLERLRPEHRPVVVRKAARARVRRVTRVVRHLDTWSVFKVAFVFNLVVYVVCLTAAVLLWNVAYSTGTVDNVENFFEQFGWESFDFRGGELYHNLWVAGLFGAVGLTGLAVLLATLFNLITDLVGGIRVTVLEEEVVARSGSHSVSRTRGAGSPRTGEVAPVRAPQRDFVRPVDGGS